MSTANTQRNRVLESWTRNKLLFINTPCITSTILVWSNRLWSSDWTLVNERGWGKTYFRFYALHNFRKTKYIFVLYTEYLHFFFTINIKIITIENFDPRNNINNKLNVSFLFYKFKLIENSAGHIPGPGSIHSSLSCCLAIWSAFKSNKTFNTKNAQYMYGINCI